MSRREFVAGLLAGFGGCISSEGGLGSDFKLSRTATPSVTVDEECRTTDGGSESGRRPPWLMSDSPADVVVSDGRKSTVEAVVSIGDRERSLTIPGRDQWVSDDVIGNGETTSVSVTTADGGETAIEWESERENEQIARFAILDDESEPIRARLQTKSPCPAA